LDPPAQLKLRIIALQEQAAQLARSGKLKEARQVRARLIILLNQLDLLKDAAT
jgi:hypothetical protein